MNDLYLVIPMAGNGTRFKKEGQKTQKALVEIDNTKMYIKAISSLINNSKNIFKLRVIIKKSDNFKNEVLLNLPGAEIIELEDATDGSLETLYLGIKDLLSGRFISLDCDLECFSSGLDSHILNGINSPALVTFQAQDSSYSYVKVHESLAVDIVEKEVISNNAVAGMYYFNSLNLFKSYAEEIFERKEKTLGEYYISSVYKKMINSGAEVNVYNCELYNSFGTPEEVEIYKKKENE